MLCYILNTILFFAQFCWKKIISKATAELLCVSEQYSGVEFLTESVFWMNWVNQWFKDPFIERAIYLIPELITHLNKSNEWMIHKDIYHHPLAV